MGTASAIVLKGAYLARIHEVFAVLGERPEGPPRRAPGRDAAFAYLAEPPSTECHVRRLVAEKRNWTYVSGDQDGTDGALLKDRFEQLSRVLETRVMYGMSQTTSGYECVMVWENGRLIRHFERLDSEVETNIGSPLEGEPDDENWGPWDAVETLEHASGFGFESLASSDIDMFENYSETAERCAREYGTLRASTPGRKPWWKFW